MEYEGITGFIEWLMYADDDHLRNVLLSLGMWVLLLAPVAHYLTTGGFR